MDPAAQKLPEERNLEQKVVLSEPHVRNVSLTVLSDPILYAISNEDQSCS